MSSESNRVRLSLIPEATWNTTPAAPTLLTLRYTGESLNHVIDTITSAEIRADRNIGSQIQANKYSNGGFNFEFSYDTNNNTFDALLESALFSAWATDTLKNGTTQKSFSIEKAMLDINEFFLYTGMVVNTFSLNISAGQIVTGSFDFMGGFPTIPNQQTTFATVTTAAAVTVPFNAIGNVGSLSYGGSSAYIKDISFTLNNNLRQRTAVGYDTPTSIGAGKCDITGSINIYFADDTLFDLFVTPVVGTTLAFSLEDAAANVYNFEFPNIAFDTDNIVAGGQDQDVIEGLTFRALYDSSEAAQIVISRGETSESSSASSSVSPSPSSSPSPS